MTQEIKTILLLISPLVLGGIITAFNAKRITAATENTEAWLRRKYQNIRPKRNWFHRFLIKPIVWTIIKFCDWTASLSHGGLKSGIRITAALYFIAVWCFIIYAAVFFLLAALAIYYGIRIFTGSRMDARREFNRGKVFGETVMGKTGNSAPVDVENMVGGRGSNIYSGTNWLNEDLKGRVDMEGNIYSGTNWLNEHKIGRIDKEGNIFRGTHFLNEEKVGRIDKDGTIHKGTTWLNETQVGRMDEDGNVYKGTNWLNERKTGRSGD